MGVQLVIKIRRPRGERHRPAALLAFDRDGEAAIVVLDVADA